MKKIVAFWIALSLLFALVPALADETVSITDRAGLEAIAANPSGHYALEADIDLGGADWVPLDFSGTLEGNGHVLYNMKVHSTGGSHALTYDGNRKEYDTALAGLFAKTENAVIRDLTLLNARVDVISDENCFAAGLAAYTDKTVIENCYVYGRMDLTTTATMVGVGGIVGFGSGSITDCHTDVTLVFVDTNEAVDCEQFLGGVLACGYSDVVGCDAKVEGFASVHGYAHNGGLVGMHHLHGSDYPQVCYVKDNRVEAVIHFFEDVASRRAYCRSEIGEVLNKNISRSNNETVAFKRDEVEDYDTILYPETCESPQYEAIITAPNCTDFGHTTYTCSSCGYSYTDDFTAPAHTPGEWVTVQEADYEHPGRETLSCALCGELMEERKIPVLTTTTTTVLYVEACEIPSALHLHYREEGDLSAKILPDALADEPLVWSSSNLSVATVDSQGHVTAAGRGQAIITCVPQDGGASAQCTVDVDFTPVQWVIYYMLFGWLWY